MGTRSKLSTAVRGHRTKAEIEIRQRWEQQLQSGTGMKASAEVEHDPEAMEQFNRLKGMFERAGLDEGFYESAINRYVILGKRLEQLRSERKVLRDKAEKETDRKKWLELESVIAKWDGSIAKINDQLMIIEKENLMTVSGRLRTIPKTPETAEAAEITGIAAYIRRRDHSKDE